MGKPLREARLETLRAATILRYAAGEAYRPIGEMYEPSVADQRLFTLASPARRRRPHHAVELPDRDPGLEARAGADLRQHARPQARVRGAAHRAPRRGVLRGGRAAGGRAERAHGRRLEGRRGDRLEPGRARDLVHRLGARGPLRPRRGDRARLPRAARARRAQPADRDRGGRARPGGGGGVRRSLLVGRAEVHGDAAHPRRGLGLRRVPREAARARRGRQGRRSGRPGGRGRPGRERGRDGGDPRRDRAGARRRRHRARGRRACRRRRATSSRRRSSRASPTTPSSRARRCSAP